MADYYSLIARAVAALPQSTPDSRQAVYERARKALFNQLRGIQPAVAEADIAAEGRALEEAIARLEIELAAKAQTAHPAQSAPTPARKSEPERAAPAQTAPRDNEINRREAPPAQPQYAEPAPAPREPQRPAAPLPPMPEPPRASRQILAVAAVLFGLIGLFGFLAWQMREKPDDLAKLPPDEVAVGGSETKIDDRIEGAESAAPKPAAQKPAATVPVAQKAEMWVASLQQPDKVDKIYNAAVVWRLDNVGASGEPVASAVRGEVDVPDAKMKVTLVFRKNADQTLSASHTVNVSFAPTPGSAVGGVKLIGPIQMRRPDASTGDKLAGIPVPITDNNFLIGMMRGDAEQRNLNLLKTMAVLDLPLQLNDGRAATISMEKGATGERAFQDAIAAWGK